MLASVFRIKSYILLVAFYLSMIPSFGFAIDDTSFFSRTTSDKLITGSNPVTLISHTFSVSQSEAPMNVLVVADGRHYTGDSSPGIVVAAIEINGQQAVSEGLWAVTDWRFDTALQRTFNTSAHKSFGQGTHTIRLVAYNHPSTPGDFFYVGAGSGMSVIKEPAPNVIDTYLNQDTGVIDLTTFDPPEVDIEEGDDRPTVTLAAHYAGDIGNQRNLITLGSTRAYQAGGPGDAALGIYRNGVCQRKDTANWGVTDLNQGAELQAPIAMHAFHQGVDRSVISLEASELVFNDEKNSFENTVEYRVGAGSRIITLWGMAHSGSAPISTQPCAQYQWICVGRNSDSSQESVDFGCPIKAQDITIATTTINIPSGHNGIAFFSAKSRIQGVVPQEGSATDPAFETVRFGIKIDGVKRGTSAVQELANPNVESSRGISASYLSADQPLAAGTHTVEVYLRAEGSVDHVLVPKDIPLVYFY